ncbi:uncharacterized protein [Diadema antillarum]|uniref:uncharacterized protein n=1 Tax=Diadema antillarum TaxID=105358 RepID=UPI003A887D50
MISKQGPPPTADNAIALPVLRRTISEPGPSISRHLSQRHSASMALRTSTGDETQPRRLFAFGPQEQPVSMNGNQRGGTRSIDMINARNFPAVMTKHFLRRRAFSTDMHLRGSGTSSSADDSGLRVTHAKYGSPAGPGPDQRPPRGILKSGTRSDFGDHGHSHFKNVAISLPEVWQRSDGSLVSSHPTNSSDVNAGGRTSVGSWVTYPLSSRPYSHRNVHLLRDQQGSHPNGFSPHASSHLNIGNAKSQTRYTSAPAAPKPRASQGAAKPDHQQRAQLHHEDEQGVAVQKPTSELLMKRTKTRERTLKSSARKTDHNHNDAENDDNETSDESKEDDDDNDDEESEANLNTKVRKWLSSLDTTLCQRYARRQMASLREWESSNYKT